MNAKKKILVIDDDDDLVTFITTLMQDNGYETISAPDGVVGLEKLKAERPDLVLLDITMPEKSGVRFYRDVREDADLKETPVIMVTGVMEQFEKFISTRRQVPPPNGYISKPFAPDDLVAEVKKVLASE